MNHYIVVHDTTAHIYTIITLWLSLFVVPAPIGLQAEQNESMEMLVLGRGKVNYFQVTIPEDGLTFKFDVEDGKVLVCGSTINQNPDCRDPSTYEWACETDIYCDQLILQERSSRKRRQTSGNIMYIAIEGINRNNEVSIEVTMGDETVSDGKIHAHMLVYSANNLF